MEFRFGKNWADYIKKTFSEERVSISQGHLLSFLKVSDLKDKTFLDIGCGSGLHSVAAWRAKADQVISFDVDEDSVSTTKKLRELVGNPKNWKIFHNSVLNADFIETLPKADIVYSWGVLHHTGSMWEAARNASKALHPDGVLYLALYSKEVYVSPPFTYWVNIKRIYNRANPLIKKIMEWQYAWDNCIADCLKRRKNPFAFMKEYKRSRGMSYWHDVIDWLGGYPIEFVGNKEMETFAHEKLGLCLVHQKAGEGNTEFLFRRSGASNYWDEVVKQNAIQKIRPPFSHMGGFAWRGVLQSSELGRPEKFMMYEDKSPVGWPNAPLSSIQTYGNGRYRVENGELFFSATDNSNPETNEKEYSFRKDFV
jgi:SAM-dependent methyltransferase